MPLINQTQLKERLRYDPLTGEFTWLVNTSRAKVGAKAGYIGSRGYRLIGVLGREYLAHRLAWLYVTGAWPVEEMDHRNGEHADNRLANLREATKRQNMYNRKRSRLNTSGFKGVFAVGRYWVAEINGPEGRIMLGRFRKRLDAAAAYREAAKEIHGEFYTERNNHNDPKLG